MRKLLLVLALLLAPVAALAQGGCIQNQAITSRVGFSNLAAVVPFAAVSVSPGPIFVDNTLAVTIPGNLITADAFGNYQVCAAPSVQTVSVSGAGLNTYFYKASIGIEPNSNVIFTGSITFTGPVTIPLSSSLIANAFISSSANPAGSGILRLASTDTVCWRNNANSGDVCLSKNASDNLLWPNGLSLGGGTVLATTNQSGSGNLCLVTNCALVTPSLNGVTISGAPSGAGIPLLSTGAGAATWTAYPAVTQGTSGVATFTGVMFQWVRSSQDPAAEGSHTVNLPTTFPTACDGAQVTYEGTGINADDSWYQFVSCNTTSVTYYKQSTGGTINTSFARVFAYGH